MFGQSADDVRKALEAVAGAHGGAVKSVTVIDPQRPHLHASFESPAVAQRVRKALDPRLSNAPLLLLDRAVKTEYSERSMPVARVENETDGDDHTSAAELLRRVQLEMTALAGGADEDGNIAGLPSTPGNSSEKRVRCPLCAGGDADFSAGRALRMHLMSTVHRLSGETLHATVLLAEAQGDMQRPMINSHTAECDENSGDGGALSLDGPASTIVEDWLDAARRDAVSEMQKLLTSSGLVDANAGCVSDRHGSTALHWAAGSVSDLPLLDRFFL